MTYIHLDRFLEIIESGDLIFGRSDSLFGKIIRMSGNCMWNHVSMCVSMKNEKYWCESVRGSSAHLTQKSNSKNLNNDNHVQNDSEYSGVRMCEIKSYINHLFAKTNDKRLFIGISKFHNNNNNNIEINRNLEQFYTRENGKPYTHEYYKLFLSWFDGFSSISNLICKSRSTEENDNENQSEWTIYRGNGKTYFCSELVVQSLLESHLMNKSFMQHSNIEIPSGEWTVANVADTPYLNRHLKNGYYYSNIVHYFIIP